MSRHRIVRSMDYNDEYDGYDDVYGHSVDDDSCISPTDAQQWLYDRARGHHSISSFIRNNKDIVEADVEEDEEDEERNGGQEGIAIAHDKCRRDSDNFQIPVLDDLERTKLNSCLDEVRNVVGDTISERRIVETSMRFGYDIAKVLDDILNEETINTTKRAETLGKRQQTEPSNFEKTIVSSKDKKSVHHILAPKLHTLERELKKSNNLPPQQPTSTMPTVLLTTTAQQHPTKIKVANEVRRGFKIPSPLLQTSPVVSGRTTPEDNQEDVLKASNIGLKISKEQTQRCASELYAKKCAETKHTFNMIVIGHVDAGKSTLMGHLLYDTGNVSQRVMHKHEQESKKLGKQSFMYAWVLDETGEERSRGITMDVGLSRFETNTKIVNLLDAPGHKDFIPNMISGATQADVALLVVDATRGEFETGFEQGGQTREHALLVRSLGVNQLGVVINKLDTVNWCQGRFSEIVTKLKTFLKQAGFKECDVTYTPCSGLTGENLTKPASAPELTSWYTGPHLLSVIDNFKIPERSISKPFRISVSDVFKGSPGTGLCVAGRVETGVLCTGDKVLVGASREQAQVKSIQVDEMPQTSAFAGDQVSVMLNGLDTSNITVGCILCDPLNPIPVTNRFQARILVFNVKVPITMGYPVLMHHQSLIEPTVITKLIAQIHKGTGEVVKKKPRCLGNNSCALVELETSRLLCVERYTDFKELGRFMLRVSGVTIAAGMVTKIL